jgi:aconitase A
VAVLSGNRNFNGRIHPRVKEAFLASPALTVIYAIAGSIRIDVEHEALAQGVDGHGVTLADLWPSDEAIDAVLAKHVRGDQFSSVYDAMFATLADIADQTPVAPRFAWRDDSTYIRRPPYWQASHNTKTSGRNMRAIAMLGDNITTDCQKAPRGNI